MERTLVVIKPDAFPKYAGEIIVELQKLGLWIHDAFVFQPKLNFIQKHYCEHKNQPWFDDLCKFMCSGRVMALCMEGNSAVSVVRNALGVVGRDGLRGRFGTTIRRNAIHASASLEEAIGEIELWFC